MADYQVFVPDKPIIADDGDVVINNTRENLMALRDAIVAGTLLGWDMTPAGGTAEEPATIKYNRTSPNEWIRLTITWGTSGGDDGNPTIIVYAWSDDDATYHNMGTATMTYDSSGNTTDVAWS